MKLVKKYLAKKSPAAILGIESTVLAIIASLFALAGIGYAFYLATDSAKLADMQSNIIILRSQINQVFAGSSSYDELNNDVAIKAGAVPAAFIKGTKLINPWGGDLTVASTDDDSAFTITLSEIPSETCTKLGAFQSDSWLAVSINGTDIDDGSVVALTEACTNDENTLIFTAR